MGTVHGQKDESTAGHQASGLAGVWAVAPPFDCPHRNLAQSDFPRAYRPKGFKYCEWWMRRPPLWGFRQILNASQSSLNVLITYLFFNLDVSYRLA